MTMDDLSDVSKIDLPFTAEEEAFLRETTNDAMRNVHQLDARGGFDAEFATVVLRGVAIYCRFLKTLAKTRDDAMNSPH